MYRQVWLSFCDKFLNRIIPAKNKAKANGFNLIEIDLLLMYVKVEYVYDQAYLAQEQFNKSIFRIKVNRTLKAIIKLC